MGSIHLIIMCLILLEMPATPDKKDLLRLGIYCLIGVNKYFCFLFMCLNRHFSERYGWELFTVQRWVSNSRYWQGYGHKRNPWFPPNLLFIAIFCKISNQLWFEKVVFWPLCQPGDQGSNLVSVQLKVEKPWLCPHTANGCSALCSIPTWLKPGSPVWLRGWSLPS